MLKVIADDIMSEEVVTIAENATIAQAAHILLRFRINGLLIVKRNDRNKVKGIITTTDLLNLLDGAISSRRQRAKEIARISNLPVRKFSSKKLIGIGRDTKIEKIIGIMHKKNKHTLPVFENGVLVGVVGKHDVLNAAYGS